MLDASEILREREISAFLQSHQGAADEIQNAARRLAEKPDAVPAMKKLLPALAKKSVFVFFSYKKKDERTAKAIVELLRSKTAGKLDITYQAEFTEDIVGQKWRDKISKAVRQSNWFILLLPDPKDDWDWCLYETGLFEAQRTSADRLICLHHPKAQIPSPIEGYQAVAATVPEVDKFLRMALVKPDPVAGMGPINDSIEGEIPEIARQIVDTIREPVKRQVYEPWVELQIEEPDQLQSKDELQRAAVREANKEAMDLFDLIVKKPTWGELSANLPETPTDGRWREELFHVIRKIGQGRRFYPVQAVFQSHDGKIYRPVLCAVDRVGEDGPIETFHLTFTEEVGAVDHTAMPKSLSVLATLLRFTFRFRWEVLERFTSGPLTEQDVKRLDNALKRIQVDWDSRGLGGQDEILALFPKENHKRVSDMFVAWHKAKNPEGTGELDIALENMDTTKIPELLKTFLPMNQEFLEMAADRFSEMVYERH
jgi:hypothetical protein